MEAARRVVAAHGVPGATRRTIAAEAGVSTGFVTHYCGRERVCERIGERTGLQAVEAAVEALLPLDAERDRDS